MAKVRKFSPEFKAQVILEIVTGETTLAQASREHGIKASLLQRWKAEFLQGLPELYAPGRPAELKRLHERIKQLERLTGRQALQLEIAEEASLRLASRSATSDKQRRN